MRCPSCGSDIKDPDGSFCPHCAAPLGADEAEVTTRIDRSELEGEPPEEAAEPPAEPPSEEQTATLPSPSEVVDRPAAAERVAVVRDRLERTGWLDVSAAAALGFLVLLVVGAVLVVAAKVNFPALGAGGDPIDAFTAVVIAALGCLGIPIVIDGVAVSALPLGAVLATGAGMVWAVRTSLRHEVPANLRGAVVWGAKVGVPFGLLCWLFALVFRFRGEHPVAADGGIALVAGAAWGAAFGIVGAVRLVEPFRALLGRLLGGVRARDRRWFDGVTVGGSMLGFSALLGLGAMLLWIIVALARGAPGRHFGAGDAFAYLLYAIAFLPNIVVTIVAMSFGAPVAVGARVNLGGNVVGPLREYSLSQWGNAEPPGIVLALVLLPIVVCIAAGFIARRRARDDAEMLPVLLVGSAIFSVVLTLLAGIARLRLAGVVRGGGFGMVAPDVVLVLLFSFLLSGVLAFVGWQLAGKTTLLAGRFPPAR